MENSEYAQNHTSELRNHSYKAAPTYLPSPHSVQTFVDSAQPIHSSNDVWWYQQSLDKQSLAPSTQRFPHLWNLMKQFYGYIVEYHVFRNIGLW